MSEAAAERRNYRIAVAAIAALTLALSWRVPWFGLSGWDDGRYYTENPLLAQPLATCVSTAWTLPFVQGYHPLHVSLICLQGAVSKDPFVWHLFSVVFFVVMGWALLRGFRVYTDSWSAAWLGAALVVAHPAMVESYASLASQKDLMAMTFGAAMLAVIPRPSSPRRFFLLLGLLTAAAWSKSGYALPLGFAPLAQGFLVERRVTLRSWRGDDVGVAVWGVVLTAIAFAVVWHVGLPAKSAAWFDVRTVLATVTYYAGVIAFAQSPPPLPCLVASPLRVGLGALAIVGHVAVVIACVRFDRRVTAFALVLSALGILPYLNLVPTPTILSGRWVLVLLLGTALALVTVSRRRSYRGILAALVVLLAALSFLAQRPWTSRRALWEDNIERSGGCSTVPYSNLATAYSMEMRWSEAEEMLVRGLVVVPFDEKLYRDWVLLLLLTEGGCQPPMLPLDAQSAYRSIGKLGGWSPAVARARGRTDVARILSLRESMLDGRAPSESALLAGPVCNPARLARIRAVYEALKDQQGIPH